MENIPIPIGGRLTPIGGLPNEDSPIIWLDEATGKYVAIDKHGVSHPIQRIVAVQFDGEQLRRAEIYSDNDSHQ